MTSLAFLFAVHEFEPDANGDRVDSIDFAKNNVSELTNLLESKIVLGASIVAPTNPKKNQMLVALSSARDKGDQYDNAVLYICSHGKPVLGKLNIYGSDTIFRHEDQTSVAYSELRDLFIQVNATNHIIILDCCYSGLALTLAPSDFGKNVASETIGALEEAKRSQSNQHPTNRTPPDFGGFAMCSSSENQLSDKAHYDAGFTAFSGALIKAIKAGNKDKDVTHLTLNEIATTAKSILKVRHPQPHTLDLKGFGDVPLIGNLAREPNEPKFDALDNQLSLLQSQIQNISDRLPPEKWDENKSKPGRKSIFSGIFSSYELPYRDIRNVVSTSKSDDEISELAFETEAAVRGEPNISWLLFWIVFAISIAIPVVEGNFRPLKNWNEIYLVGDPHSWAVWKQRLLGFPISFIYSISLVQLIVLVPFRSQERNLYDRWLSASDGKYAPAIRGLQYNTMVLLKRRRLQLGNEIASVNFIRTVIFTGFCLSTLIASVWAIDRASPPSVREWELKIFATSRRQDEEFRDRVLLLNYNLWESFNISEPETKGDPISENEIVISYDAARTEDQAFWIARQFSNWYWPVRVKPRIDSKKAKIIEVWLPNDPVEDSVDDPVDAPIRSDRSRTTVPRL